MDSYYFEKVFIWHLKSRPVYRDATSSLLSGLDGLIIFLAMFYKSRNRSLKFINLKSPITVNC